MYEKWMNRSGLEEVNGEKVDEKKELREGG